MEGSGLQRTGYFRPFSHLRRVRDLVRAEKTLEVHLCPNDNHECPHQLMYARGAKGAYGVGVELRVHDESALLPVDLAEILLARSPRIRARAVDLPYEMHVNKNE